MKLAGKMRTSGTTTFYDEGFRRVVEDHLEYLRNNGTTKVLNVAADDAVTYEYDLYTYLLSLNFEKQVHWIIMRLNNFKTPTEFGPETTKLLVPDTTVLELMRRRYVTSHSIWKIRKNRRKGCKGAIKKGRQKPPLYVAINGMLAKHSVVVVRKLRTVVVVVDT